MNPGQCVKIKIVLSTLSYNAKYTVNQRPTGYFGYKYDNKVQDHYYWFTPMTNVPDQSKLIKKT